MSDLVVRKLLVLPFAEDHKPKTLLDDSALGYWLAMSQRHGTVRCREGADGAVAVLVARPDPMPGDPPFVTRWFKLKPDHVVEWGDPYKGHRTIGLLCASKEAQRERVVGIMRKVREKRLTEEDGVRRITAGVRRSPVKFPSMEAN